MTLEDDFHAWTRRTARRRVETMSVLFGVVLFFAFVIGRIVLAGTPQDGPGARVMPLQLVICVVAFLAMRYAAFAARYPLVVACAFYFAICGLAGYHLGQMGGFDGPFFYAIYTVPAAAIVMPARPIMRVLLTWGPPIAFMAAFVVPHPQYLSYPMLHMPIVTLLSVMVIASFLGHWVYTLMRDRFDLSAAVEEQRLALARQKERIDIARRLHDDIGQLIVGAKLELDVLDRQKLRVASGSVEADNNELRHVRKVVDELDRSTRVVVEELRRPESNSEDIVTMLERLFEVVRKQAGLTLSVETDLAHLKPSARETVFRVIQESLTNALKHARASHIEVSASCDASGARLSVADNGAGFDTEAARMGWGLTGIQERVRELGGSVQIESVQGAGTRITAQLPNTAEGDFV